MYGPDTWFGTYFNKKFLRRGFLILANFDYTLFCKKVRIPLINKNFLKVPYYVSDNSSNIESKLFFLIRNRL